MEIIYLPSFLKQFKKCEHTLQEESFEKIELLKDKKNHRYLKVHKLRGRLAGRYSFSVNYRTRIVFIHYGKNAAALLSIGDHAVYDN